MALPLALHWQWTSLIESLIAGGRNVDINWLCAIHKHASRVLPSAPIIMSRMLHCSLQRVVLALLFVVCALLLASTAALMGRAHGLKGKSETAAAVAAATARGLVPGVVGSSAGSAWAAAAAGCDMVALMGDAAAPAPLTLTWHAPPDAYLLFAYGPQEYVTQASLPGAAVFFEQHVSDFLVRALRAVAARRPGPAWFLDVGANIGVHTGAVATAGFPVLAVEGFPTTAARLTCSRLVNHWSGVTIAPEAIASSARKVCFAVRHKDNQGMNWLDASSDSLSHCPAGRLVQARTLSDIVEAYAPANVISPAVVKLDIEGSELTCLQSFARHLDGRQTSTRLSTSPALRDDDNYRWRPELFLAELRPQLLRAHSASIPDVIEYMNTYGYRAFFADGSRELTHFASRGAADAATIAAAFNTTTCPNFIFVRHDTVLSDDEVFHAEGCTDD